MNPHRVLLPLIAAAMIISGAAVADMKSARRAFLRADYAAAHAEFLRLARTGDADAQTSVAEMYLAGRGVEQNPQQAVEWFRAAARQGDAVAQVNLGLLLARAEMLEEAAAWLKKAAEQGDPQTQTQLATMYFQGVAGAPDSANGLKWLRRAANQGFAEAQNQLGFMYAQGDGVARDLVNAYAWYHRAAMQGAEDSAVEMERLADHMTAAQIAKAKQRSNDWKPGAD